MIKIVHPHLEMPLIVGGDKVQLFIIENPNEFYRVVRELGEQFNGEEGDFYFTENDKQISPSVFGDFVESLFSLDMNGKRQINLLYKLLEKETFLTDHSALFGHINVSVCKFFSALFGEQPFSLCYQELSPMDLFKMSDIRFEENYSNLTEKIICYINEMIALKKSKFFVFINLKSFLSDEDLLLLYHHCCMEKVGLLLLESSRLRPLLLEERATIITEDLCEILVSNP